MPILSQHARFLEAFDFLKNKGTFKSKAELARLMGRDYSGIAVACNGRKPQFNETFLAEFARTFGISLRWLIDGAGEMLAPKKEAPAAPLSLPGYDATVQALVDIIAKKDEQIDRLIALLERQNPSLIPYERDSQSPLTLAAENGKS